MHEGKTCNMMRVHGLRFDKESRLRFCERSGNYFRKPHSFSALPGEKHSVLLLCVLAFFFLLGLLLGYLVAERHAGTLAEEIRSYLEEFSSRHVDISDGAKSFAYTLLCYVRYPLLAFLFGFASFGALFLPLLSAAFAFSLSYSVCCFAFALGRAGVLLAASLFAFRSLISVPCYFLLAYPAFGASLSLLRYTFGLAERNTATLYSRMYFYRFLIVLLFLLSAAVIDPWLSSRLMSLCLPL